MTDQIFIKPRPGMIVAEIPRGGVLMDTSLANTYLANGLAVAAVSKEQAMSDQTQADRAAELQAQADLIEAVDKTHEEELPVIGDDNGVPKTNHLTLPEGAPKAKDEPKAQPAKVVTTEALPAATGQPTKGK
jgi:hypothetical protein